MRNEQSYTLKDLFQDTSGEDDDRSFVTDDIDDRITPAKAPARATKQRCKTAGG